jgi:hypothetical protein
MSAVAKTSYIEKVDERGDLKVWVIDGSYIRTHIDEEFLASLSTRLLAGFLQYIYIPPVIE